MGRGSKTCKQCGASNGPRSFNCVKCGKGFVVKGKQQPDIDLAAVPVDIARSNPRSTDNQYWSLVELYEGEDEKKLRKKYDIEGRTWQSHCGRYRIREQITFMGVNMKDHFKKYVYVLKKNGYRWDIVRPVGCLNSPIRAIKRMVLDKEGRTPRQTGKKARIARRKAALKGAS